MDAVLTMLRVVVSLAAVLGVIWFLHRRVSRRQLRTKKKANPVVVVGKQGIAAKASVVVVDVDGRRLVLGVTEHSVNVLHSSEPTPVADAFAAVLAEADALDLAAIQADALDLAAFEAGADADDAVDGAREPVPALVLTDAPVAAASPVAGSILSASTWKLALTSVRNGLK